MRRRTLPRYNDRTAGKRRRLAVTTEDYEAGPQQIPSNEEAGQESHRPVSDDTPPGEDHPDNQPCDYIEYMSLLGQLIYLTRSRTELQTALSIAATKSTIAKVHDYKMLYHCVNYLHDNPDIEYLRAHSVKLWMLDFRVFQRMEDFQRICAERQYTSSGFAPNANIHPAEFAERHTFLIFWMVPICWNPR
jgi:hypothetical protein